MSARPARHLSLVDRDTGEVVDSRELAELQADLEKWKTKFKMAQRDVAAKNLRIAALEADRARERLDYERYADVQRIAKYWHLKVHKGNPRVNPMSPDRFDAIRGILDQERVIWEDPPEGSGRKRRTKRVEPMYSLAECKAAIDGCHFDHFVKKRRNGSEQHFNDLEFIFRNSKNFEECRARSPHPIEPVAVRAVPCETTREGSKQPSPSTAHRYTEVHYGHLVGVTDRGFALREQTGRLHVRGRVAPGYPGEPASRA